MQRFYRIFILSLAILSGAARAAEALDSCDAIALNEQDVTVNGIQLHVLTAGSPAQKEMILFLHGFPESSVIWKQHLRALACAGYYAVAPDMRGYGLSDKPKAISDYAVPKLVADVKGLVHALGYEQTYLVGHDWGGIVSWFVADMEPELIKKAVIINASHPARFVELLLGNPKQLKASEYVFRLALPNGLDYLTKNDFAKMRSDVIENRVVPLSPEDEAELVASWQIPGAIASARNYYLDFLLNIPRNLLVLRGVKVPVLVLWGQKDDFQVIQNSQKLEWRVPLVETQYFPEATHWLPREFPEQVIEAIEGFISK